MAVAECDIISEIVGVIAGSGVVVVVAVVVGDIVSQ